MSDRIELTLGHSPDPDDAFMFYALAKDKIDTGPYHFTHVMEDIQTLNERATRGELDITAISIHAYAYVLDKYALLPAGASMGFGYGPMVVAPQKIAPQDLADTTIAIPGKMTSRTWNCSLPSAGSRLRSCPSTRSSPAWRAASSPPD